MGKRSFRFGLICLLIICIVLPLTIKVSAQSDTCINWLGGHGHAGLQLIGDDGQVGTSPSSDYTYNSGSDRYESAYFANGGSNHQVVDIGILVPTTAFYEVHSISFNFVWAGIAGDYSPGSSNSQANIYNSSISGLAGSNFEAPGSGNGTTTASGLTYTSPDFRLIGWVRLGDTAYDPTQTYIWITSIQLCGNAIPPTSTPTPSPTLTPTAADLPVGIACPLMRTDTAFPDLGTGGTWVVSGGVANPTGTTSGLTWPSSGTGSAAYALTLNPFSQYEITLNYHTTTTGSTSPYPRITLGQTELVFPFEEGSGSTWTSPAASYTPDTTAIGGIGLYSFKIAGTSIPSELVIDSACVREVQSNTGNIGPGSGTNPLGTGSGGSGGGGGTDGGVNAALCQTCTFTGATYTPTGDILQDAPALIRVLISDLVNAFGWLFCQLSSLFYCVFLPALRGVWTTITLIFNFIIGGVSWLLQTFISLVGWVANAIGTGAAWLAGFLGNAFTLISNTAISLVHSLGLDIFLNNLLTFIGNLPSILVSAVQWIVGLVQGLLSAISAIIGIVIEWVSRIFNYVGQIFNAIGVMISSLIAAITASASTIPTYAPDCTANNTFFYGFCLATYIVDNTIFDGPLYLIIPVMISFFAWLTFLWLKTRIQSAVQELGGGD